MQSLDMDEVFFKERMIHDLGMDTDWEHHWVSCGFS